MSLPSRPSFRRPVRAAAPLALAAALALSLAGAAHAQPYGSQQMPPPGQSAPPASAQRSGGGGDQTQLSQLHASLRITAAQEAAWRAFAAAEAPDAQQEARERSAEQMLPSLTAPQRVDLSIDAMEADLATMRARGAALKAFYAVLTPDQRRTFDRQTLPREQPE